MMSKAVTNAAGELAKLFDTRDSDYPQDELQSEITVILLRNGIGKKKFTFWERLTNRK